MSKLSVPYVPYSQVWTKINLDKYSSVYPTYLPKKFGHFGTKVFYPILNFDRNLITRAFLRSSRVVTLYSKISAQVAAKWHKNQELYQYLVNLKKWCQFLARATSVFKSLICQLVSV